MVSLNNQHQIFSKRLAISAAVATALLSGYGSRRAYAAGTCTGAAGTYTCSGAAGVGGLDPTQVLNAGANPLIVTTNLGFGIDTSNGIGDALTLSTIGTGLTFTDNYLSLITGGYRGIYATNSGTGATSITSTGTVTGTSGDGVRAFNMSASSTNLIINTVAVSGDTGILVRNYGTGFTSITSTGTVAGTINGGIAVINQLTATDLIINTAAVSGTYGISMTNNGTGATSITSTGMVSGTTYFGIFASNQASATGDFTINTAAVSGRSQGIYAFNNGTGALSITSTGTVTGTLSQGVYAKNIATSSTNLTVNTAAVSGGTEGIRAINSGSGALSITSTGTVTGASSHGVYARNMTSTGTNLTVNTAAVSGRIYGIFAMNNGKGATSITSTGTVTGTISHGVTAFISGDATNLTINTAAVSGGNRGISANNTGTGATSITSTGTVSAAGYGIRANNGVTATDLTINTAAVSGGTTGIRAINSGTGETSITVNGAVTGSGKGSGISNSTTNNSSITLNSGAAVSAASGLAIQDGAGNTTLTINTGASVTGIIDLGDGTDAIALSGGDFSGVSQFDGGLGANDSLKFAGSNGIFNQTLMTGIESVTIGAGSTMGLTFTGNAFNATALTGSALTVSNGGILNATNGFALTGNLINSTGIISTQNSTIDATATINGNFTGGGQLLLDANFATNTADTLNITGNVLAGGTQVSVNDISTGPATGAAITLISVGGTTTSGDFALAAPVVNGAFNYNTLALVGGNWILQSVTAGAGGASVPVYTPFAASFEALGQNLLTLETLSTLAERNQQRLGGANSGDATGIDSPIWLRIAGGYRDIDSHRSTTGANFDTKHWKAQVGVDFAVADTANGRFVAGINAGYNQADTDVKSTTGKSNIDTTGYSLGLTGTWYGLNGVYVDTQLQRSWYKTDLSAGGVGAGKVNDVDGDGYSASVEIGQDITLNDSLSITPQAQLVYAKVDADTFTGANAEVVKLSKSKSLKARLGATLTKRFTEDGATHGFVVANVIREFEDETQVNVSGAQLANAVDQWSGELGVGMTHAWNKGATHYELSASVTGSTSLNHVGDSKAAQGKVGFKVNF